MHKILMQLVILSVRSKIPRRQCVGYFQGPRGSAKIFVLTEVSLSRYQATLVHTVLANLSQFISIMKCLLQAVSFQAK